MNMNKAVRELAKSASRALGALYGTFVSCGGMTYSVFIKLCESTVSSTVCRTGLHAILFDVLKPSSTHSCYKSVA
jgi:hypothetical protein